MSLSIHELSNQIQQYVLQTYPTEGASALQRATDTVARILENLNGTLPTATIGSNLCQGTAGIDSEVFDSIILPYVQATYHIVLQRRFIYAFYTQTAYSLPGYKVVRIPTSSHAHG